MTGELQRTQPRAIETPRASMRTYTPRVDVFETDDALILYADLPGVKQEDVSLTCKGDELVLHATCAPRHAGKKLLYSEYGVSDFHRAFKIAEQVETLAELQQQGLIRHLGVSNVTAEQVAEARSMAPIVSVQNHYNVARRGDDELVDLTAREGIAFVPYFPLGGFSPLQSDALDAIAERLGATPLAVALAWLLQRSPNILLIPGTSSVAHLRENVAGAQLELPAEVVADLDAIAG